MDTVERKKCDLDSNGVISDKRSIVDDSIKMKLEKLVVFYHKKTGFYCESRKIHVNHAVMVYFLVIWVYMKIHQVSWYCWLSFASTRIVWSCTCFRQVCVLLLIRFAIFATWVEKQVGFFPQECIHWCDETQSRWWYDGKK